MKGHFHCYVCAVCNRVTFALVLCSLSETQLTILGDVELSNLYAVLVLFIGWIEDGFHEFHKLPLLLKEEMRHEDSEMVREFCLKTGITERNMDYIWSSLSINE